MTGISPIGRWQATVTPENTPISSLVWLPAETGGLGARVVTMAGRPFAVLRPIRSPQSRQWNVRIEGFVWFSGAMPEGSAAGLMKFRESSVGGFLTLAKARKAVGEAHELLKEHLLLQAA